MSADSSHRIVVYIQSTSRQSSIAITSLPKFHALRRWCCFFGGEGSASIHALKASRDQQTKGPDAIRPSVPWTQSPS